MGKSGNLEEELTNAKETLSKIRPQDENAKATLDDVNDIQPVNFEKSLSYLNVNTLFERSKPQLMQCYC